MAAKKPEKSKQKQITKEKKSAKIKKLELKPKNKIKAKRSDKAPAARASAVEKAKAKVRTAFGKVTAKVVKSVQSGRAGGAVAPKASATKAIKAAPLPKVEKAAKVSGKQVEKNAKAAKAVLKKEEAPTGKKAGKAVPQTAKAELSGKKHAASKNKCREVGCDNEGLLSGYCRLHYIKNWRRIKKKESILSTGQLDVYVEELVAKYPDKYLDAIENDLASEKEWAKVISDLELGAGGEEDFVAEEDDNPITEATGRGRGAAFDDEDEDVY